MFPSLRLQISELDPNLSYCVFLELVPVTDNRYKYSDCWSPSGSAELQSPHRIYLHPESPATGAHWMSQTVHFNRLKLTNSVIPQAGQVVLNSMHKYQPKVIIVQTTNPQHVAWAPSATFSSKETQFIAVTAYQVRLVYTMNFIAQCVRLLCVPNHKASPKFLLRIFFFFKYFL